MPNSWVFKRQISNVKEDRGRETGRKMTGGGREAGGGGTGCGSHARAGGRRRMKETIKNQNQRIFIIYNFN